MFGQSEEDLLAFGQRQRRAWHPVVANGRWINSTGHHDRGRAPTVGTRPGTRVTAERLRIIYEAAGLTKCDCCSEIGPVLYRFGHLSNDALLQALRQSIRPDDIGAAAVPGGLLAASSGAPSFAC